MDLKDYGDALYRNGDHPKALKAYLAALLQEQNAGAAGSATSASNRTTTGKKIINSIQLARQQQRILSNIVATCLCMKQYKEALTDANRCIACDPTWLKSYVCLAEVHVSMRQDGLALDVLTKKILEQDPDNVAANRMVNELLAKLQRVEDVKNKTQKGTNKSRQIWWLAFFLVAMVLILPRVFYRYLSTKEPVVTDYYAILGVHKLSSSQDIKSAYRDLALKSDFKGSLRKTNQVIKGFGGHTSLMCGKALWFGKLKMTRDVPMSSIYLDHHITFHKVVSVSSVHNMGPKPALPIATARWLLLDPTWWSNGPHNSTHLRFP